MGNQLGIIQQQWSPSSEPLRDVPLEQRPHHIVVECPVQDGTTQQLLRCEISDAETLDRAVTLYNDTKYSLRWQWVRRLPGAKRERDIIVVWVYTSEKYYTCYRVGPRTLQEIDTVSHKKNPGGDTYTLFDWINQTAAKYAHYEPMWIYETEQDDKWPMHAFFRDLCFHSTSRVHLPLVINVPKEDVTQQRQHHAVSTRPVRFQWPYEASASSSQIDPRRNNKSSTSAPGIGIPRGAGGPTAKISDRNGNVRSQYPQPQARTLIWTLVYKARDGYEGTVQELRERIHNTSASHSNKEQYPPPPPPHYQRNRRNDQSGGSGSAEEEEEEDEDLQSLHDQLTQYLDFDDPWVQTAAARVDPKDDTCVRRFADQLRERLSEDATEEELLEFARRRLVQLREDRHRFLPNSFADRNCPGLSLLGTGCTSPFDFYAQIVMRHPIVPPVLREQALQYHYPGELVFRSQEQRQRWDEEHSDKSNGKEKDEGESKMVVYGKKLVLAVDDYCFDHMIPRRRLQAAFEAYRAIVQVGSTGDETKRASVDRSMLSLFFLRRAGEWLEFWGARGYGFAPRWV